MDNFSFLDQQLVQLLLRICADQGCAPDKPQQKLLDQLVRYVSAATREGTIAVSLSGLETESDLDKLLEELPVFGPPGTYTPLVVEDRHLWLNRYWQYEQRLAQNLQSRLRDVDLSAKQLGQIQQTMISWQTSDSKNPIDWQQRAVALAASSYFSIISGGPGTGKTTTVTRLLWLLTAELGIHSSRILLAAPTGKAAMRLQESIKQVKSDLNIPTEQAADIPEEASTLHRLLGYIPGKVSFRHHRQNTLAADVVIIDEASMIDISLMTHLLEAVPPNARLILLGDKDQLTAVETGSVFRDLCAGADNQHSQQHQQQLDQLCHTATAALSTTSSNQLADHIVVLQKSWRFTADSGIGQLATSVRNGQNKQLESILQKDWSDIHWMEDSQLHTDELMQAWQDYFRLLNETPRKTAADTERLTEIFIAFNRFRILTPLRNGPAGTEQLNQRLGQAFRRHQQNTASNSQWYSGRPVMVTQNDYRQQLFNGDIGLTLRDGHGELRVWFPQEDGFRAVSPVRLPNHETAWAMTIHKSQGSEFEEILLLLPEDEEVRILGRELLYTGITRAKSGIQLRGKLKVLQAAMRQVTPPSSRIRQRLEQTITTPTTSTPAT